MNYGEFPPGHVGCVRCKRPIKPDSAYCRFCRASQPDVKRGAIPMAAEGLVLYCKDSPRRPGYDPVNGDVDYTLTFPLHDGTQLLLHMGPEGKAHFIAMLAAEAADDADESLRQD